MTEKSIRTPLGKARGLGSAHEGVGHWWAQRVTACALIPLAIYLAGQVKYFLPSPESYGNLIAQLGAEPFNVIALLLFIGCAFYHGYLGVQIIIEDYIHSHGTKLALLLLNKFYFLTLGVTCAYAVLYINFALIGQVAQINS